MTQPLSGGDLDRAVSVTLNERVTRPPVPYSTSARASERLARFIDQLGFTVEVEETTTTIYCTLLLKGSRIATGSGETRELAIARAVVNCRLPPQAGKPPRQGAEMSAGPEQPLPNVPGTSSSCSECGMEVRRLKKGKVGGLLCNLCSWKRIKSPRPSPQKYRQP